MGKRIVVALGGNALGHSPEAQRSAVQTAAEHAAALIEQGHELILGHGNGPQVGIIAQAMDAAAQGPDALPAMPFAECAAMSQGYIGYHLQQAMQEALRRRGIDKPVAGVVTQVLVDGADPAFQNPEKPIGRFCTQAEAEAVAREKGWVFRSDAGRGWRRVVPSPAPREIVELEAIRRMVSAGIAVIAVIAAGGGGVPVVRQGDTLCGVDAVIDKDRACALLARELDADVLLILTAVDRVCLRYGQPDALALDALTLDEARRYMAEGHFAPGSMLPKVEAAVAFASSAPGRYALITSLEQAEAALAGHAGTRIG